MTLGIRRTVSWIWFPNGEFLPQIFKNDLYFIFISKRERKETKLTISIRLGSAFSRSSNVKIPAFDKLVAFVVPIVRRKKKMKEKKKKLK